MEAKSGYFFYPVMKPVRAQFFTVKGGERCKFRALDDACSVANIPRGVLCTRVNPDACRICEGVEIFQFGQKKLRIQKCPDKFGRGVRLRVNVRPRLTLF